MAISLTPTLSAQRWGPRASDLFDFYANATRDSAGNPLLIYRHGGGGTSGTYVDDKTIDREPANVIDFLTNPATAASLPRHFDVISIGTPQRTLGSGVASGDSLLLTSAVRELQRAIAEIKRLGTIGFNSGQYKTNPYRVGGMGESWGATAMMLSQLFPAFQGAGAGRTYAQGAYRSSSFDSSLAFLVFNGGQPDVRKISGTDQIHFSQLGSYFGTDTTAATELNQIPDRVRETLSCLAYFTNGDFPCCPPTAVLYNIAGDHVHPYGTGIGGSDIHDSQQGTDLAAALAAAGIQYISKQYVVTDAATGWQNGTAGKLVNCKALYDFIAAAIEPTF